MKTIVQQLREEKNLTQTELAEKSGLSLRTIQRIEAGNIPKGFTLKTLAKTFGIEPEKLISAKAISEIDRVKLINLSSLLGLIVPFGNIIFPLLLTNKTRDKKNKELGKCIISVQILLSVLLSLSLIVSPFIQKGLSLDYPLFLISLLTIISIKVLIVILNGVSLNRNYDLHKKLKINYL
jgi:transcriptional regulator with XRE-family HTH domain